MTFIYEGLAGLETISLYVYLLVLLGGMASALSICYLPVLAMFGGYMSGRAQEGTNKALRLTVSFTVGMIVTSAVIGIFAAFVGQSIMQVFTGYHLEIWIPASVGIIMGLQLTGVIRLKMPKMLKLHSKNPNTTLGAFSIGLPFGLVITPCTIPIFLMIISYVVVNADVLNGALLLSTYAVGKGMILGIVATSSVTFFKDLSRKWSTRIEKVAGSLLILLGIILILYYYTF